MKTSTETTLYILIAILFLTNAYFIYVIVSKNNHEAFVPIIYADGIQPKNNALADAEAIQRSAQMAKQQAKDTLKSNPAVFKEMIKAVRDPELKPYFAEITKALMSTTLGR